MENNLVLFADTDSDITPEIANEYGYNLISMPYKIDDTEVFPYNDGKDIDFHAFYDKLRAGAMPTTSALSPKMYEDYFEPYFKQGKDVLYVHFSKAMSGTFNALKVATENLKQKYPDRTIYLIDTKAITICSYNIVKEIGDMFLAGKSLQEVIKWSETEVDKFAIYFFANDLSFFKRSGRVKAITALMGNMLGIRPIIHIGTDGIMTSIDKARGLKQTLDKIMDYVDSKQENIKDHRIVIGHTDDFETAKTLGDKIKAKYGEDVKIEYVMVNPTAGSHCGPNGVGICFHATGR